MKPGRRALFLAQEREGDWIIERRFLVTAPHLLSLFREVVIA